MSDSVRPPDPPRGAARLPADERRARIVRAFMQEALAGGAISAVGIRAVCAREGCTAPVLYRLFGDRAGLVRAAVRSSRDPLVRRLECAVAAESPLASRSALDRLRELAADFFERPLGDDEAFEALVASECRCDPGVAEMLRDVFVQIESLLVALLEQGRRSGDLRADLDARYAAWRLIDLGLFRNQAWLMGLEVPAEIAYVRRATASLIDEIAA